MRATLEPIAPNPTTPKVDPASSFPLNCFLLLYKKGSSSAMSFISVSLLTKSMLA